MTTAVLSTPMQLTANMGEIVLLSGEQTGQAILGSCLGIILYDGRKQLSALAHVVLPQSEGRPGPPGKFVDSAIPWMINSLRSKGADSTRLTCKLAGGANMFANSGPFQIGQQNIAVARRELERTCIRIFAEHLEGTQGRRITFDNKTGKVFVDVAGVPAATL